MVSLTKPIFTLASKGDLLAFKEALDQNPDFDINQQNKQKQSLLFCTTNDQIIDFLLKREINIFSVDQKGRSCLHHHLHQGYDNILRIFHRNKLSINIRDSDGRTILPLVNTSNFHWIYQAGLDLNPTDNRGLNYHQWALNRQVKQLLKDHHAYQAEQTYQDANEAFQQRRLKQAILLLEKALEINKNYANAYINLSQCNIEVKEYHRAIKALIHANQLKPNFALIFYNMGVALDARGDFKNCFKAYNRALKIDQAYYKAYLNRATILLDHRHLKRAETDFLALLKHDKRDADLHYNLACLYALQNRIADSYHHLHTSLKIGLKDKDRIMKDHDLEQLRNSQDFKHLHDKYSL